MAAKKKRSVPSQEDFDDVPEFTDFGDLGDLRGLAEVGDIDELRRILATAVSRDDVDKASPKRSRSDAAAEPAAVGKQGRRDGRDREGKPGRPEKQSRPEKAPPDKDAAPPSADDLDDDENAPKSKPAPKAKKVERPIDAPPKRPAFRSEDDKAAVAERRRLAAKGLLPTRGKAAELAAEKLREKEKEKEKGKTSRDGVAVTPVGLRIIGGKYRRKRLEYGGDQTVRPMKDRVREALFNLLGTEIEGLHAFDLFAGTGAIGLEALSRGAAKATFVERHFPTADVLRANIKTLGAEGETEVFSSDTFYWWLRTHVQDSAPRAIFVCPPYDLFETRREDLEKMIRQAIEQAAPGSICVVESDERWSASPLFDDLGDWDVREYPPARIGILRKE